jgi:hypothetical protein
MRAAFQVPDGHHERLRVADVGACGTHGADDELERRFDLCAIGLGCEEL